MQNKLLIVEDDIDLSTMYKIKFEKEGFDVKVADNGLVAVTYVTDFKPDVILLDIMMPSMDGFETLKVIRDLAPSLTTKIIMFSNLNSKDDIDKCMKLGADDYLLKANTTPKEAVEKVKSMLGVSANNDNTVKCTKITQKCPYCNHSLEVEISLK